MTLIEMIKKYGVNAKLKRAVMGARGWRRDEWYAHWPKFAPELVQAIENARCLKTNSKS